MTEHTAPDEFEYSVATTSPSRVQKRLASAVVGILLLAFAAIVPFASIQLGRINSFVPTVEAIILVTDLATAVLLFNQFAIIRGRKLLILADGYLFSALIVIAHALSYPGAFTATGIFGPSLETTPWLFTFWHFGFSAAAFIYACMKNGRKHSVRLSNTLAIFLNVFVVTCLICLLTFIATRADVVLPHLMRNEIQFAPMANYVTVASFVAGMMGLIALSIRGRSLLDLWVAVALIATIIEQATTTFLITSRFSVGFYAGRGFSVVVSAIVLLTLFSEIIHVYWKLSNANMRLRRERESKLANVAAALAAVSHEMNQPLTVIVMKGAAAGRLLGKTPADSERVKAILEDIVKSGYRAGAVLENIRALFKPDDQPRSAVEMNQLISDGLQILRSELDSLGISVRKHFDPRLPSVFGHKGQLQEVILNLVQNSIDAMQNTKDQKRLIQVETKCLDQKMILISVSDSGPGFNPDNISNIFEAFATTKSTGMGLGLAISQGIVERHGGKISATTNPNGGAKLEITLPIAPDTILQAADVRNEVGYRG